MLEASGKGAMGKYLYLKNSISLSGTNMALLFQQRQNTKKMELTICALLLFMLSSILQKVYSN